MSGPITLTVRWKIFSIFRTRSRLVSLVLLRQDYSMQRSNAPGASLPNDLELTTITCAAWLIMSNTTGRRTRRHCDYLQRLSNLILNLLLPTPPPRVAIQCARETTG